MLGAGGAGGARSPWERGGRARPRPGPRPPGRCSRNGAASPLLETPALLRERRCTPPSPAEGCARGRSGVPVAGRERERESARCSWQILFSPPLRAEEHILLQKPAVAGTTGAGSQAKANCGFAHVTLGNTSTPNSGGRAAQPQPLHPASCREVCFPCGTRWLRSQMDSTKHSKGAQHGLVIKPSAFVLLPLVKLGKYFWDRQLLVWL